MIHAEVASRGSSGPALMLVHGFPLNRRIWDPVAARLSTPGPVILPDLRGHGRSPLPAGPCAIEDYARDLLELADSLKIRRFFAAGHSMGGYILFALHRLAPERLLGGALVSSRALPDSPEVRKTREATAEKAEKEGSGFLAATMPERAAGADPRPEVLETLRTLIRSASPAGVAAASRAMASRPDATPQLPHLTVPTVVLAGRQDQIVPPAESESMARAIPGAKLVWCERSGHVPMLEEPELVARELGTLVR